MEKERFHFHQLNEEEKADRKERFPLHKWNEKEKADRKRKISSSQVE